MWYTPWYVMSIYDMHHGIHCSMQRRYHDTSVQLWLVNLYFRNGSICALKSKKNKAHWDPKTEIWPITWANFSPEKQNMRGKSEHPLSHCGLPARCISPRPTAPHCILQALHLTLHWCASSPTSPDQTAAIIASVQWRGATRCISYLDTISASPVVLECITKSWSDACYWLDAQFSTVWVWNSQICRGTFSHCTTQQGVHSAYHCACYLLHYLAWGEVLPIDHLLLPPYQWITTTPGCEVHQ